MPTRREPEVGAPGFADNAVLRPGQKRLLGAFARSPLAGGFYLSGGTALAAFHLFHRLSDDLRARFLGAAPSPAGLEMRMSVDPAEMGRFFGETARRWVRESLDEE